MTPTHAHATAPAFGLSAALALPVADGGRLDPGRGAAHAVRLIAEGCDSVTLFGTTGEGASLGPAERAALHDAVLAAGVAPGQVVVAVVATAVEVAEAQALAALERGARRLLLTPPFYFRGVAEAGVHDWLAAVAARLVPRGAELILYHIPQVTGVALSPALVGRLRAAFGPAILGVKDSAGDWAATEGFLAASGVAVLVGDERLIAPAMARGAAGSISGLANVIPGTLARMIAGRAPPAGLDALVAAVCAHPVTPAVKALVAHHRGDPAWAAVRPPLLALPPAAAAGLAAALGRFRAGETG